MSLLLRSACVASILLAALASARGQGGCLLRNRTPAQLGTSVELVLAAPGKAGAPYLAACSLPAPVGIPLGDGRVVPLAIDPLLILSLTPGLPEFGGFQGSLDARGEAALALNLPFEPALDGLEVSLSAIVADPAASAGVARIAPPLRLALRTSAVAPDFAAVGTRMQQAIATGALGGASLLVADDWGVRYGAFFGGFGPSTVVPVASATKWISALVLMTLVDDGLLSFDSALGTWYPALPAAKQAITLRQLFSHTSGLPMLSPCLSSSSTTLSACADQVLAQPLIAPPGTVFAYGGASMQVAGAVAERAVAAAGAPASWDQLFQQRFAQPLGLQTMSYGAGANPRIAGGLSCDLADLGPVLRMLLAAGRYGPTEVVSAASLAAMLVETGEALAVINSPGAAIQAIGYGFGVWRTAEDANGTTFEAGSMGAFGSVFWVDFSRGYGAWLLTLDDGTADASALLADLRPLIRAALDLAP